MRAGQRANHEGCVVFNNNHELKKVQAFKPMLKRVHRMVHTKKQYKAMQSILSTIQL